jgi:hypothetical protein
MLEETVVLGGQECVFDEVGNLLVRAIKPPLRE